MSFFAAGVVVFVLFVASYSRRNSTRLALCSMSHASMALSLGCLFLLRLHDHSQVRISFAWAASRLSLVRDRQIAYDLAVALEHLAASPGCDIGRQGCSAATSAALLPTKRCGKKQPAAAAGGTETKPDPKAIVGDILSLGARRLMIETT